MNHPDANNRSVTGAGARAGACTAAALLLILTLVPAVINSFLSPVVAGWLPVIVVFTFFWAVIAAILGGIVGAFAARTRPWKEP
jgi:hypothetical protein